ncbi:MAG: hypothetical protein HQL05_07390 [Nitrospirae bacterium]|uniref:hypothetical protein n=1 Tax=Candidatus Magnetobacterium casense TaxID=1455061 RepID=UPI0005912E86|nr:hypothetical protein [Candidatus Magnetobacterium casensis]MBF0337643.1 hypothetical protein [Nitrospirota bacterium]
MFRLIRRVISAIILGSIAFLVIALYYGGDKFLWFGTKAQEVGQEVKQLSEKAAEKADEINVRKDSLSDLYKRAVAVYHGFLGVKSKPADKNTTNRKDNDEGKDKRVNQDN